MMTETKYEPQTELEENQCDFILLYETYKTIMTDVAHYHYEGMQYRPGIMTLIYLCDIQHEKLPAKATIEIHHDENWLVTRVLSTTTHCVHTVIKTRESPDLGCVPLSLVKKLNEVKL